MFCPECGSTLHDESKFCLQCGKDLTKFRSAQKGPHPLSPPDDLDEESTILSFTPGTLVDHRYEVLFKLGEGGMGRVYAVRDQELKGELRAVKILPSQIAGDPKAITRLKEEARLAMSLTHQNIVKLFNYDRDDQTPYLVMEFVNGIDLYTYLALKGRLKEAEVKRIAIEVAEALKEAHEGKKKIIHRDIKPGNILLVSGKLDLEEIKEKGADLLPEDLPDLTGCQVKLTDFGIARQVRESMSRYS